MPRPFLQILFGIAVVIAFSSYWNPRTGSVADEQTRARMEALPKTYLDQPRSWRYDETGRLADILEATRAEYFSADDETLLDQPRFYAQADNDRSWSAAAHRGRYKQRRGLLFLRGSVNIINDQSGAEFNSRAMTVNFKQKTAQSHVPVTVTHSNNSVQAKGMTLKLNSETVLMKPDVESLYAASPS
ncbi:MAG: LPS export ABC transporter periplasmic protein LptC [Halioglobus sp.]